MININFIMKQMLNDMQITTVHKNNQIKENPWILSQLLDQYFETNW